MRFLFSAFHLKLIQCCKLKFTIIIPSFDMMVLDVGGHRTVILVQLFASGSEEIKSAMNLYICHVNVFAVFLVSVLKRFCSFSSWL